MPSMLSLDVPQLSLHACANAAAACSKQRPRQHQGLGAAKGCRRIRHEISFKHAVCRFKRSSPFLQQNCALVLSQLPTALVASIPQAHSSAFGHAALMLTPHQPCTLAHQPERISQSSCLLLLSGPSISASQLGCSSCIHLTGAHVCV